MLGKLIVSFLISASPFGELKAGMPYAEAVGITDWAILIICIAGNLLVFPIIELFMTYFGPILFKSNWSKRKVIKLKTTTKRKTQSLIEKYGFWGLLVFVAIPMPGTGAYFGTIAAYVFDIEKKKAALAISLGILITGVLYFCVMKGLLKGLSFLF
jgi:uncharacterized membrane protein